MTALGKYGNRGSVGAQGWLNVGCWKNLVRGLFNENDDLAIGRRLDYAIFSFADLEVLSLWRM
jgi:hypothetical protein